MLRYRAYPESFAFSIIAVDMGRHLGRGAIRRRPLAYASFSERNNRLR